MKTNKALVSQNNSILTLRTLYLFVMALPWLWLLLLGIFVFVITLEQGAYPSYGHPDPKYAGTISLLYLPTELLMVAVIGSAPTGLLLTLLSLIDYGRLQTYKVSSQKPESPNCLCLGIP